ncbi:crossover junction endodeoxyribonuclease RuvC [Tahibacter amnicola]|uniref:Crossover junction endodeoxyribonuclease RuvC n=1 Tax=Tahibacter amnicola TaxID=2976241 RepID=A0ABY6BH26_9GAMM|nr:crossover junction endodeoxyribonuclease RuvC [Tahibacter amnicola]UXI67675.1 crossover junction endodeoxyribonuclease RuvC [Tahibacter amnicola]
MSIVIPGIRGRAPAAPLAEPVRVLGIDPGSQRTGVGIIDVDATGRSRHVFHATLSLTANENFALRLKQIFDELGEIIQMHQPQEVAIERVFMAKNADSALKLGQARGAAICAVVHRGLAVNEYAAKEIKQAVVGGGGADKTQIQHMVGVLLQLPGKIQADAADALAIALAHAHTRSTMHRIGIPRTAWRRRR